MCKYAVVDLEMCKVPKSRRTKEYHWANETIQIGAVLLDEFFEIIDQFKTYVAPQSGRIDSFITRLTRITPEHVKDAPVMEDALKEFEAWLPEDVKLVAWSDSDRSQICHEVQARCMELTRAELLQGEWLDCQQTFDAKMNASRQYGLTEALNLSDIMYEDGAHDGLVDAYNTALLFAKLMTTPDYKLNEYYSKAEKEEAEPLSCCIGDMFAGLQLQCYA